MSHFHSPIGRVRIIGCIEGISFILLMGIAMPLKYIVGQPLAVKYLGRAHGVFFIILCLAILQAWIGKHLSFKYSVLTFIAALLPFGPFIMDRRLAKQQRLDDPA